MTTANPSIREKKMKKQYSLSLIIAFALMFTFLSTSVRANDQVKIRATHELFKAMDLASTFGLTISKMLDVQIKQNPKLAPLRKVMTKFFDKYMGWETMKDDMAKIYSAKFSLAEINELIAFYKTPIGKKMAKLVPELSAEGAALGQQRVQSNLHVLRQMIQEEVAKQKKMNTK